MTFKSVTLLNPSHFSVASFKLWAAADSVTVWPPVSPTLHAHARLTHTLAALSHTHTHTHTTHTSHTHTHTHTHTPSGTCRVVTIHTRREPTGPNRKGEHCLHFHSLLAKEYRILQLCSLTTKQKCDLKIKFKVSLGESVLSGTMSRTDRSERNR